MQKKVQRLLPCLLAALALLGSCSHKKGAAKTAPDWKPTQAQKAEDSARRDKPPLVPAAAPQAQAPAVEVQPKMAEEPAPQYKETEEPEKNASAILEDALSSYQDAQTAWEKGESDQALAFLDETYGLILKAKVPADSPLVQDKNDLRRLVAQKIQQIYASKPAVVGDNHRTIPLDENKYVLQEIQSFQTRERKPFEDAYRMSGLFRPMILEELRKEGMPEELSWLPMIESWFKIRALSRARALGLWQFIHSTGARFGLKQDRWVDERMDPVKATRAAVKYLNELHSYFGDWTTALAAYNCGEVRVQNVIRTQRLNYLDNFWDLYLQLPLETARFVPRLIACLLIINDPAKYGFNLPAPEPALRFETVMIRQAVKLSSLAQSLGLEPSTLAFYNPDLRFDGTPEYDYDIKVPVGYGEKVSAAVQSLPRWIPPEATFFVHYVRSGETVGLIARKYRTTVAAIARLNNMRRTGMIWPGQRLKIPGRGVPAAAPAESAAEVKPGEKTTYVVRSGDGLDQLARVFATTAEQIKADNKLQGDSLTAGQTLLIANNRSKGPLRHTVNGGETLFSISKLHGMDLDEFLTINKLSADSIIYAGQELWVTPKK
ncbi:MAG: LysM peptidoglycan-binding domain-containing protein [Candidatus Aminicenantes bacterium]|nr:LysM peptidoglycan-binding domain-containing protein [Candidatus Aminicenantes bacterium]